MQCRHVIARCARKSTAASAAVLPFDQIPSPRGLPLVGTTLSLLAAGGPTKLHRYVDERHRTLGPIYKERLGPVDCVFVAEPEDMRAVFAQEGKFPMHVLPEAWIVYNQKYGCKRGLFFMDGPEWRHDRQIANKLLLKGNFGWIERACDVVTDNTLESIKSRLKSDGRISDLEHFLYKWSLDNIVAVLLGAQTYQKYCKDFEYMVTRLAAIIHLVFQNSAKLYLVPSKLASMFQIPLWKSFVYSVDNALDNGGRLVTDLCCIPYENLEGLLPKLLEDKVRQENVKRIVTDLILAAGDTTAYTMEWMLYLLAKNKTVQKQLRADNTLSKNVLKETLRLYPVAPFLTRILPNEATIAGYSIPAGTVMILSIYTSGKDEQYFKDATRFDPARWNKDHISYKPVMQMASLPFAMGSRSCIGRKIAEIQLHQTVCKIVNNFEIDVCNEKDVEMVMRLVGVPSEPVQLKFSHLA